MIHECYLDHAAGTPLSPRARRAMEEVASFHGNPSSIHRYGREARVVLESARAKIAHILSASPEEIVFTGSGSEADALAVLGVARAHARLGKHIVVSAIEHKAVLKAAQALAKEGFEVTTLSTDSEGYVTPERVAAALRDDTTLVSVMYANNEIGTVEPIADIARAIRARGGRAPLFHTDACQAPGLLPLSVAALGVDLMTINSSKTYGPKGIGALYARKDVRLLPIVEGGSQERGMRAGTESVALAAGFATALAEADAMRETEVKRLIPLRRSFIEGVRLALPDAVVNGSLENRLANNIHVSIPHVEGEALLLMLDAKGIACATGSACNATDLVPSHVLLSIGQSLELAHGSLRFSMGRDTTEETVSYTLFALAEAVRTLRGVSASVAHASP